MLHELAITDRYGLLPSKSGQFGRAEVACVVELDFLGSFSGLIVTELPDASKGLGTDSYSEA
jgi:hypothetical protein